MSGIQRICLLGFGEVGQLLAQALSQQPVALMAYDRQFSDEASVPSQALSRCSLVKAEKEGQVAVSTADLVISAVTAEQNLPAARAVIGGLKQGAWFLDLNSVSPQTKREVAVLVKGAGGRYVEAAVMSPIQPQGIASPILLGGPHAEIFAPAIQALGFSGASCYSAELGRAAATKMCRSILIKGLESLLTEALVTARHHHVEDAVVSSLQNLMPGVDWNRHAAYMISRSLLHGTRRAEEMREAAATVTQAGLVPRMSEACAATQAWTAQFGAGAADKPLADLLDELLNRIAPEQSKG